MLVFPDIVRNTLASGVTAQFGQTLKKKEEELGDFKPFILGRCLLAMSIRK